MECKLKNALQERCGGGNTPETGTQGTAALTQALRTDVAIPKLYQGTAPSDAHAPAVQLGPPRASWQEPASTWWSQAWGNSEWDKSGQGSGSEGGWQSRATSVSSDASTKTKAQDKRARRQADPAKLKSELKRARYLCSMA